uniref:Uncharacterized protein n=1 Tax=Aegilops tauschii subsp. strangulata TaxID=200361 RepID=A0A453HYW9_AEGTS
MLSTTMAFPKQDNTIILWRDKGSDDYPVNCMSLKELCTQLMYACLIKLRVGDMHNQSLGLIFL